MPQIWFCVYYDPSIKSGTLTNLIIESSIGNLTFSASSKIEVSEVSSDVSARSPAGVVAPKEGREEEASDGHPV